MLPKYSDLNWWCPEAKPLLKQCSQTSFGMEVVESEIRMTCYFMFVVIMRNKVGCRDGHRVSPALSDTV